MADIAKRAPQPCWGGYQSQWHFVNDPYLDDPGSKRSDYPFVQPIHNSTEAVNAIVHWFNEGTHTDSPITSDIVKYSGTNLEDGWSIAMRLLMHYVGDMHQPLHDENRLDKKYPKGDAGGNAFTFSKSHYGVSELHALWDSTFYEFHVNPKLPFTDAEWATGGA